MGCGSGISRPSSHGLTRCSVANAAMVSWMEMQDSRSPRLDGAAAELGAASRTGGLPEASASPPARLITRLYGTAGTCDSGGAAAGPARKTRCRLASCSVVALTQVLFVILVLLVLVDVAARVTQSFPIWFSDGSSGLQQQGPGPRHETVAAAPPPTTMPTPAVPPLPIRPTPAMSPPPPPPSPPPPPPSPPPPPPSPPPPRPPPPPAAQECSAEHCTSLGNDCCAPNGERATCANGFTPLRTGGGCFHFTEGAYVCCRPSSPEREAVLSAFRASGLLVKVLGGSSHAALLRARSLEEMPLAATDCGQWCAAYTLLHPRLPVSVFDGGFKYVLMHDARPMWDLMQCSAVVDSNSEDRSCCSRNRQGCDWPGHDQCHGDDVAGYCAAEPDPQVCQIWGGGDGGSSVGGGAACAALHVCHA